jgi:transposase
MSPEAMATTITQLQAELAGAQAEAAIKVASLEETITGLAHEIALLKRRLYGNKTERSSTSEVQLALGDLLAGEAQLQKELDQKLNDAAQAAPPEPEGKGKPRPHGRRNLEMSKLPRVVIEIRDEELEARGCRRIGFEDSRQFAYRPGGLYILVKRLAKYEVISNCAPTLATPEPRPPNARLAPVIEDDGTTTPSAETCVAAGATARRSPEWVVEDGAAAEAMPSSAATADRTTKVVVTPSPVTLFPKGLLHTSTIAHIVTSKFALGTPHYRLEQALADHGVPLDRGLMSRYVEHAGNTLGATVVAAMWRDAIANGHVISTDATGALIQPSKAKDGRSLGCKKGHFFTAVVDADAVLFQYVERHTSEVVQQLFGAFRGVLQADASAVYNILERGPPKAVDDTADGVTLVGCWAHCRRYFFEAALCRYTVGVQGLMRIRAIFAVDRAGQRVPRAERTAYRATHLGPLFDEFFAWARTARETASGNNLATKALGYALNQEAELRRVLADGELPLDNTRAERALRKIVVGRKNWMFYGSDTHAEAAAAIFSLIASCRLHRLDPFAYLEEVLRVLPSWPRDRYLELAPVHWAATRARLDPEELDLQIGSFTVPADLPPTR